LWRDAEGVRIELKDAARRVRYFPYPRARSGTCASTPRLRQTLARTGLTGLYPV